MPYEINKEGWDLIIAVGVMEHLCFVEFEKTIEHFLAILNLNGEFLFDVPNLKKWCQYYIDGCDGKYVPFDLKHILSTLYGWQRWKGDEHKSGWSESTLKEVINKKTKNGAYFEIAVCETPEIFKNLGLSRNRFDRVHDSHFYIRLIKRSCPEILPAKPC